MYYPALKKLIHHYHSSESLNAFFSNSLEIITATDDLKSSGAIFLKDEDRKNELNLAAAKLDHKKPKSFNSSVKIGDCLAGKAFEDQRSYTFQDVKELNLKKNNKTIPCSPDQICVPIIVNEEPYALLYVFFVDHKLCESEQKKKKEEVISFLETCTEIMASFLIKYQKKRTIDNLNQEKNKLFDALNEVNLVSRTDPYGKILYVNEHFCQVSKYSPEELIGKPHSVVSSGLHDYVFWENFWESLESNFQWHGEICNRTKDGHIYWVDTKITAEKSEKNEVVSYLSIRKDITEKKRKQLQNLREIEQREKSAKLESLHLIAAGIGHEINNPLTIAKGYLRVLKKSLDKEGLKDKETAISALHYIDESHRRIKNIVKNVKNFSRVKKPELSKVEVLPLLKEIERGYVANLKKDFFIKLSYDEVLKGVQHPLDEQLFRQVIINLINNSIDAFENAKKAGCLKISFWCTHGDNVFNFYFSDNGPGLGPEQIERVFDIFFTTKAPGKGSGLGLALSQEFCYQMNGKISILPNAEEGLTFKIKFRKESKKEAIP